MIFSVICYDYALSLYNIEITLKCLRIWLRIYYYHISNIYRNFEIARVIFLKRMVVQQWSFAGAWAPSQYKDLRMVISMLKIRRPLGRLIFNMGIAIPGKTVFLIETAPWFLADFIVQRMSLWNRYSVKDSSSPFYYHGLTLIPAWISNYMPGKVWGEITYPFLNFNGCTVEV